jgi:hypothetical protein
MHYAQKALFVEMSTIEFPFSFSSLSLTEKWNITLVQDNNGSSQ